MWAFWGTRLGRYFSFVRFSHTLFALPYAAASMLAAAGGCPPFRVLVLILGSMVTGRNVAMGWNRLVDADLDGRNPRTKDRHLPAGLISRREARWFILLNGLLFVGCAALLNGACLVLSPVALALVLLYSHTKRFTWSSHLFLGLAIGASVPAAWIAVRGSLDWFPLMLGASLLLWIAGFDIIYSTLDLVFDRQSGLHSIPARFGVVAARNISRALHAAFFLVLVAIGFVWKPGLSYVLCLFLIGGCLLFIHFFRRHSALDRINEDFFLANVAISGLVFLGLAIGVLNSAFQVE